VRERWLDLCSRYGVSGRSAHDARLVALMLAHGLTHLLTLNSADFARYAEITAVTPDDV
jgi:predicted nucleic acid-binding protein